MPDLLDTNWDFVGNWAFSGCGSFEIPFLFDSPYLVVFAESTLFKNPPTKTISIAQTIDLNQLGKVTVTRGLTVPTNTYFLLTLPAKNPYSLDIISCCLPDLLVYVYKPAEVVMSDAQILLRVLGLTGNQSKTINLWEQPNITTAIKIESIYIDSPADDRVRIEVLTPDNIKLTERFFDRSQTPYDFPDLVLSRNLKIRISSTNNSVIDRVFIYASQVAEPLIVDF